jgi:hypothetical protein
MAYEDEGSRIARSPKLDESIAEYLVAMRDGDLSERTRAMNAVIDVNRADHASSGIPAYAHLPLPDDFVTQIVKPFLELPTERTAAALQSLVDDAAPDRRAIVRSQLTEGQRLQSPPVRSATTEADDDTPFDGAVGARPTKETRLTNLGFNDSPDNDWVQVASAAGGPGNQPPVQEKRIVKPYRRYASPGGVGPVDRELQEAEAIARDADVTIRKLTSRVVGNPEIEQSSHQFLREFARAVRRYYAEDGDRAVAAVASRLKEQSIDADHYAAYSPYDDRIYFTRLNRKVSDEEKIITVIHEVLHATTTMKGIAAKAGYDKASKSSIIRAQHEAYVDNVAKTIAKKLGLIPQNYPPTDWRSYLRR